MKEVDINLNSVDKVKQFVEKTGKLPSKIDLVSGRYRVDGKSVLGIYSLDLAKPLKMIVEGEKPEDEKEALRLLDEFIIGSKLANG